MSIALYRLGRLAARRPWAVLGVWLVVAVAVVSASSMFGRELEDSFEAPGLDSTVATDLLTSAASDSAGPTAQVVVTPRDGESFFSSPEARSALAEVQASVTALPNVLGATDPAGALSGGEDAAIASGVGKMNSRMSNTMQIACHSAMISTSRTNGKIESSRL